MPNQFLRTIRQLLETETVVLYEKWTQPSATDQAEVGAYLTERYQYEAADYPFAPPAFDSQAGLWAAQTTYAACQLLLHRSAEVADLLAMLPPFSGPVEAEAMLSADLTLRFLPDVLTKLHLIDPDDPLVGLLETHLHTFHYSAIRRGLPIPELDLDPVLNNACLRQLYVDRIIRYKNKEMAIRSNLIAQIRASLGMFAHQFWPELAHTL
ncbi:MAG: hypothetical protein EAZ91_07125 [Cytophagales bacterium]|nr:MAG: hypothetical protein EAZ91_07125 [Cytophagales bacterium]